MFPAGLEPATFRVLGGRDNHYTTETTWKELLLSWNFSDIQIDRQTDRATDKPTGRENDRSTNWQTDWTNK